MHRRRDDNYFVDGYDFAKDLEKDYKQEEAPGDRSPHWYDPIKKLHMRSESDVVIIFSGFLMN